jgi:transposase InsO family protein
MSKFGTSEANSIEVSTWLKWTLPAHPNRSNRSSVLPKGGLHHTLTLKPCFTPVKSPQSNGISESFANTIKRNYVRISPLPNADQALVLRATWFEAYNENHPHSGLKMR